MSRTVKTSSNDTTSTHGYVDTGEVIFDQGRYWIETGSICSLDDYGTAWTEVLGNIHENPELLK